MGIEGLLPYTIYYIGASHDVLGGMSASPVSEVPARNHIQLDSDTIHVLRSD